MKTFNVLSIAAGNIVVAIAKSQSTLAEQIMEINEESPDDLIVLDYFAKDEWKNGTGYFDQAVTDHIVPEGFRYAVTVDDLGRLMLIAKTAVGNVVVFERHTGGKSNCVIVSNEPNLLRPILPSGAWSVAELQQWFAPWDSICAFTDAFARELNVPTDRYAAPAVNVGQYSII